MTFARFDVSYQASCCPFETKGIFFCTESKVVLIIILFAFASGDTVEAQCFVLNNFADNFV